MIIKNLKTKIENWFEDRGLQVINFQVDHIESLIYEMVDNKKEKVVSAAAPETGKKVNTICLVDILISEGIINNALVLIKDKYELDSNYVRSTEKHHHTFSIGFTGDYLKDNNINMIVSTVNKVYHMPESFSFDLLIIEVDNEYSEKKVRQIIKEGNISKQLMLFENVNDGLILQIPVNAYFKKYTKPKSNEIWLVKRKPEEGI